jgi:pimeloyl-ACP methyl ester carboxylesterase
MTTTPIRGASLFVKKIGNGYPLVLMHGGPGLDHTSLLPLKPLANKFTMVFYDHRCNGRSDGAEVSSMTWDNLTADAESLRQSLGFDKWAVLGHSFGGMVALEYALRYPQSLSHLILMDTNGDSRWVQQKAPELLLKRGYSAATVQAARRFFTGQLKPTEVFPIAFKFAGAYYHHFDLFKLALEVIRGPHPVMRPEAQVFGFSQIFPGWTVMDRLKEIKVPTLVMSGRDDFLSPTEHIVSIAAGIANARLEIIERAGHNAHEERNAEVLEVIRDFLADVNPG